MGGLRPRGYELDRRWRATVISVVTRTRARGRASGAEVEISAYVASGRSRDGKIYLGRRGSAHRDEALEAAGLSE